MKIIENPETWPGFPLGGKRTNRLYPWDEWTDGQWREAVRGEDFTCTAQSFTTAIRHHAKKYNKQASLVVNGDAVLFRLLPNNRG